MSVANVAFGMTVRETKDLFFDRESVVRAVDRTTHRVLSRSGAIVRTKARDLTSRPRRMQKIGEMTPEERRLYRQRRNKKGQFTKSRKRPLVASRPGEPPRLITGLLRQFILFSFDPARHSVVVGPRLLPSASRGTALPALEYGGTSIVRTHGKSRRVRIAARPFMRPALRIVEPKLVGLWRDAVR